MKIISRAEWGALPAKLVNAFTQVYGWVLHWVGGSHMNPAPTLAQSCQLMRNLQVDAFNRGYNDFEYNFAVDPCGRIFEGRGWLNRSGANGNIASNAGDWSVVYLAGPGVPYTAAAREALLWLTKEGQRRVAVVGYVKPHRAVQGVSTDCPGNEGAALAAALTKNLLEGPTVSAQYPDKPAIVSMTFFKAEDGKTAAVAVTEDGNVIVEPPEKFRGEPYGKSYWGSRKAARVWRANEAEFAAGKRYVVVAVGDGSERYAY